MPSLKKENTPDTSSYALKNQTVELKKSSQDRGARRNNNILMSLNHGYFDPSTPSNKPRPSTPLQNNVMRQLGTEEITHSVNEMIGVLGHDSAL